MNQSPSPMLDHIKKLCINTSCVFTVLTLFLLFIQWLLEENLDKSINAAVFLMILPLSLCIAGAGMLRKSERIPTGGKVILHPLLCIGGIFLAYLPYMTANKFSGSTVLVHLVFFAAVYGIVTAVVCVLSMIFGKEKQKTVDAPYKSQFKKDKN